MKSGNRIHDFVDDYVHDTSNLYDDMSSDSKKLLAWFYDSYYGPDNIFPVFKTRKHNCLLMLGLTLAVAITLLILNEDWNIFNLLDDVPFFAENDYYNKVGDGGNIVNYGVYLVLCEGAVAFTLSVIQLFIIDKAVGKKRLFSREGICFWLLSIYLAALFGRLLLPLMKWYINNPLLVSKFSLLSWKTLFAALVGAAFFFSTSSGITAIIAVYLSIPMFFVYTGLKWNYYILLPFDWVNRVTGHAIFTNADIIQGIGLTIITQLLINFIEWLPFWNGFIVWLKRKITTPVILLIITLISGLVACIGEGLGVR